MLTRNDFLALVLPPLLEEGECYCTTGINDSGVRQRFVDSVEAMSAYADELVSQSYNVFFAVAKYGSASKGRKNSNAVSLRAFYLDLDCGFNKPYADLSEGLDALRTFCKATSLPRPTIVKSGVGAHVYWILDKDLPREDWIARAETLKDLCNQHGFKVDGSVTCDVARILRIPGTLHLKDPSNPITVDVLTVGQTWSTDALDSVLPKSFAIAKERAPRFPLDAVTLSLMGNQQSRFRTIIAKSIDGRGCAQLLRIFSKQEDIPEPLWRAGLSIAERCVDRDKAIHVMSNKHPDYDFNNTEAKASATKGPYTCETFKTLNPTDCLGCPHKFTSPIQLGVEIVEAVEEDNVVVEEDPVTKQGKEYVIPKYPAPYLRGKSGGIYVRTKAKNEEGVEEERVDLIYPHDFYVVKRIIDPELGETVLIRIHKPKDGVEDFIMPLSTFISKDKFLAAMAGKGIIALNKRQEHLMSYVAKWVETLQVEHKADTARRQFGWLPDESAIVVGDREIRATEIAYNPPTEATLPNIGFFETKGSFHVWKNIINYYGRPGMEYRAFPFFMGFGTLLMHFTGLEGFLLNLVGRNSGTGKTTVLQAINSIYGHPKHLLLNPKDTYTVRMQRLGVMNSLAVTMDEITNMDPDTMSQQIYDITSGRGKNRADRKGVERMNNTNFKTGVISSSNRTVTDILISKKTMPDGELKRIMEIVFPDFAPEDATWSRNHFEPLMSNYGHAIQPFAQALVGQARMVEEKLKEVRERVDRIGEIRQNERYWAVTASLGLTGGAIAKQLNLHDIPIKPVFDYSIELIRKSRDNARAYMFNADEFLSIFLQRRYSEILVINGNKVGKGLDPGPIKEPRGALTARYEPDTKMLYVSGIAYRDECAKNSMNVEESLAPYRENKSLIIHEGGDITRRKRIFSGTTANNNAQVSCLWFDTTKLGFFKEDLLLDNRESDSDD
jgi:energy-coupling factor transporter ATP-binding protein EcfA2